MKSKILVPCLWILATTLLRGAEDPMSGFREPQVAGPRIPDRSVNATNFGAIADGRTLNTEAFHNAIASLVERGGGRLVIPPGHWLTGPIGLKSRIELHLEEGALVQFTADFAQYPTRDLKLKNEPLSVATSPIYGEDLEDVAITGRGVMDGTGEAWRPVKKIKMTENQWKALLQSGGVVSDAGDMWWPSAEARLDRRPVLLKLLRCRRILLEGVTFQNSPMWNLNPVMCEELMIRGVTVRNPWFSQNGDGLDLEHCRNVIVRDSRFDVGDDAICLKSGLNERGRRIGVPTENVLIENCVVYHGHGGFTIGSEMSGGVRNIRVNNCLFMGTDVGLRFKSTRGRGGVVENIFISNIRMMDISTDAIGFNMYYGGQAPTETEGGAGLVENKPVPVGEGTPQFRNIYIQNVICRGAKQAVALQGLPEMPIRGVHLRDVSITADNGISCVDAADISLENVEILNRSGAVLNLVGSRGVRVDRLSYAAGAEVLVRAHGTNLAGIVIQNTDLKSAARAFHLSDGASRETFKVE